MRLKTRATRTETDSLTQGIENEAGVGRIQVAAKKCQMDTGARRYARLRPRLQQLSTVKSRIIVHEDGTEEIFDVDEEQNLRPVVEKTQEAETEYLVGILDHLFTDIGDETELSICELNKFLQDHHDFAIPVLRESDILPFLDAYFVWQAELDKSPELFRKTALVLSHLFIQGVYSPTEICEYRPREDCEEGVFIELFREKALSDDLDVQIAVTSFYAACVHKNDIPQVVIDDFFEMAVTCTTTFNSVYAQKRAFYFLERCLRYGKAIPDDCLYKINALIYEVLTKTKGERTRKQGTKLLPVRKYPFQKLHPLALMILGTELELHPEQYPNIVELINVAKRAFQAADDNLLVACYELFSTLFKKEELPMEEHLESIDCVSVIDNIDSIEECVAKAALNLIMDITSRGEFCASYLVVRKDLLSTLGATMNMDERSLPTRKKIYRICRNILLRGDGSACGMLMTSTLFSKVCEDLETLREEESFFSFMHATIRAMEKIIRIGELLRVRTSLDEIGIFFPIMNQVRAEPPSQRCSEAIEHIMKLFRDSC